MPAENAQYINQLVKEAPLGNESISEGDNHLRAIKTAVFQSFPNIGAAVTATPADLNAVPQIQTDVSQIKTDVSQIQTDLDAIKDKPSGIFASCRHNGTTMLYENNISAITPIANNAGYTITFNQPAAGFDQYYAVLCQPYATNGKHVVTTVTSQTNNAVDITMLEFDFPTQTWQQPENAVGFSLVMVDMQQS